MQAIDPQQGAPPPLKPNCLVWYAGDPCDQSIQQYHQTTGRLQQREWQISVTGPLHKQIADQQKQIADQENQLKALQLKIESKTSEALQSEARNQILLNGVGAGIGAALAFLVAVAGFRRLASNSASSRREPDGLHLPRY
jgi:hypothetical protein